MTAFVNYLLLFGQFRILLCFPEPTGARQSSQMEMTLLQPLSHFRNLVNGIFAFVDVYVVISLKGFLSCKECNVAMKLI